MDQRLFCPHCSAAYETSPDFCLNCGGAIPDAKWPKAVDLPVRLRGAAEASEESALEKRDADEGDDSRN